MREIKFRVWVSAGGKYFYPHDDDLQFSNGILLSLPNSDLEQYTGLKDKNGREIYEGDIVAAPFHNSKYRVKTFNYPVVFITSHDPCFTFEWWKDFSRKDYRWIPLLSDCEVIGNIHENPELLK
jgi:uncharacterized phage protein (TIGR01671 family)